MSHKIKLVILAFVFIAIQNSCNIDKCTNLSSVSTSITELLSSDDFQIQELDCDNVYCKTTTFLISHECQDISDLRLIIFSGKVLYDGKYDEKIVVNTPYCCDYSNDDNSNLIFYILDSTTNRAYMWTSLSRFSFSKIDAIKIELLSEPNKNGDSFKHIINP